MTFSTGPPADVWYAMSACSPGAVGVQSMKAWSKITGFCQ
ncbi:hypothetical protein Br6_04433 [Rhodococcus sp. Br-6]|nr:hypothetical protein Br6_04433 [Rhodococcus sp. Br-6]